MNYVIIFVCLWGFTTYSHGVTLSEFTSNVLNTHPFIKSQALHALKHQEIIHKTRGVSDWNVGSSLQLNQSQPAQISPFTPKKMDSHSASLSGTKTMWKNGSSVHLFSSMSQLNQDSRDLTINGTSMNFGNAHFFENQLGVTYTYPLLNNRHGMITRYPFNHATQSQLTIDIQLIQDKEQFLLSVIEGYLQWVLLDKVSTLTQKKYDVAKTSLQLLNRKFKANLIEKLDILRQENYMRNIEQELLKINAKKNALVTELSLQSSIDISTFISPEFDSSSLLSIDPSLSFQDTFYHLLFESSFKLLELEKNYFIESRKPQLDLGLSYALSGSDTSFSDTFSFNDFTRYISLTYSKPLYNISNNADINRKNIDIAEAKEHYKLDTLNFTISKEKSLSELTSYKEILTLNLSQINLSEQTVIEEKKLYDKGKGNLTFVLQAQDNAHETHIQYIRNLVTVHLMSYQYYALTDQLFNVFNAETPQ